MTGLGCETSTARTIKIWNPNVNLLVPFTASSSTSAKSATSATSATRTSSAPASISSSSNADGLSSDVKIGMGVGIGVGGLGLIIGIAGLWVLLLSRRHKHKRNTEASTQYSALHTGGSNYAPGSGTHFFQVEPSEVKQELPSEREAYEVSSYSRPLELPAK